MKWPLSVWLGQVCNAQDDMIHVLALARFDRATFSPSTGSYETQVTDVVNGEKSPTLARTTRRARTRKLSTRGDTVGGRGGGAGARGGNRSRYKMVTYDATDNDVMHVQIGDHATHAPTRRRRRKSCFSVAEGFIYDEMSDTKIGRFPSGHTLCSDSCQINLTKANFSLPLIIFDRSRCRGPRCRSCRALQVRTRHRNEGARREGTAPAHPNASPPAVRPPVRRPSSLHVASERIGWPGVGPPAGVTSKPVVETKVHFSPRF